MHILLWIIFGYLILGIIVQPLNVGKPRRPKTEGEAVGSAFILGVLALLVILGGHWS